MPRFARALLCGLGFGAVCCDAALNIGADVSGDMVRALRESIFVPSAYVHERRAERCTSLEGPDCVAMLLGKDSPQSVGKTSPTFDGPGVIPERLFHDLGVAGVKDLEFATPEFSVLEALRQQQEAVGANLSLPSLTGPRARDLLRSSDAASGFLHFHGLFPDSRVPLSFSRGLPHNVTATWDGRWLVRGLGSAVWSSSAEFPPLALPAPEGDEAAVESESDGASGPLPGRLLPTPAASGDLIPRGHREVSATAELAGSLGYIRFSQPVAVRSLFVRWPGARADAQAVVGGRLGLESVWTTHLDPFQLREGSRAGNWLDVADGMLKPVDEIAFIAAHGLEVGALEVVAHNGREDDEQLVLVLSPQPAEQTLENDSTQGNAKASDGSPKPRHRFALLLEKITPLAAPYLMSLQDVIDRNLRLGDMPRSSALGVLPPSTRVAGLRTARSPPVTGPEANFTWELQAGANQAVFEHSVLAPLVGAQVALMAKLPGAQGQVFRSDSKRAVALATSFVVDRFFSGLSPELLREFGKEKDDITEALRTWVQAGGAWRRSTPSVLPRSGSEEALGRYLTAKRHQTKLDMLTAAFLHYTTSTRGFASTPGSSPLSSAAKSSKVVKGIRQPGASVDGRQSMSTRS